MSKLSSLIASILHPAEVASPFANDWQLIGTRVNGEEDYSFVSGWLRSRIAAIESLGLSDDPAGLTCYVNGRTFQYMLVFNNPNGEILGIYRTLRNSDVANESFKHPPKPGWQLIGTRVNGEETYSFVSEWLRSRIAAIEALGISDDPADLTRYVNGKTFQYMLVFNNPNADILGIYRTLRNSEVANQSFRNPSKPRWQLIGSYETPHGGMSSAGSLSNVPKWVLEYLHRHEQYVDIGGKFYVHRLKGKRFRYKGYYLYHGHGHYSARVWKRPRMWYWQRLYKKSAAK